MRVNATAVVGAGLGVLLADVAHAKHPAQVVVALTMLGRLEAKIGLTNADLERP